MAVYIRAYRDLSFELILTDGKLKKKRLHILINPGKFSKLPDGKDHSVEINPKSLTHILAMQTSVEASQLIKKTVQIAEITNKPIITNQSSANELRSEGIPVRQLRIVGYEEEIIEDLRVDPVYKEEIPNDKLIDKSNIDNVEMENRDKSSVFKISNKLFKLISKSQKKQEKATYSHNKIDPTKPIAVVISLRKKWKILIPLDNRGISYINEIIKNIKPWLVIIPHRDVSFTYSIAESVEKVLIIQDSYHADEALFAPKAYNIGLYHDTYIGGINSWLQIDD